LKSGGVNFQNTQRTARWNRGLNMMDADCGRGNDVEF